MINTISLIIDAVLNTEEISIDVPNHNHSKLQARTQNMISLQIPKPLNGRRFVITDIHGCSLTLEALVQKIKLTKTDQLFFLGDYIDRGNDSGGVIDFILDL